MGPVHVLLPDAELVHVWGAVMTDGWQNGALLVQDAGAAVRPENSQTLEALSGVGCCCFQQVQQIDSLMVGRCQAGVRDAADAVLPQHEGQWMNGGAAFEHCRLKGVVWNEMKVLDL